MKPIVPAILTIPADVANYDLLVNPLHLLDIAFTLPGLILGGLLLISLVMKETGLFMSAMNKDQFEEEFKFYLILSHFKFFQISFATKRN